MSLEKSRVPTWSLLVPRGNEGKFLNYMSSWSQRDKTENAYQVPSTAVSVVNISLI